MLQFKAKTTEEYIPTNGIRLHTIRSGESGNPLIVLLHGFPEFWGCWKAQIDPLTEAGYQLIVPDQRGYNKSDHPRFVRSYNIDILARDILGLIEYAGKSKAFIVGHDWGGAVAWHIGAHYAEKIEKIVVLNCPPPFVLKKFL